MIEVPFPKRRFWKELFISRQQKLRFVGLLMKAVGLIDCGPKQDQEKHHFICFVLDNMTDDASPKKLEDIRALKKLIMGRLRGSISLRTYAHNNLPEAYDKYPDYADFQAYRIDWMFTLMDEFLGAPSKPKHHGCEGV